MKIDICIPCMNRWTDLRQILPGLRAACLSSPPAEIIVLDYNSSDGLSEKNIFAVVPDAPVTYRRFAAHDYFHMAHARNLAMLAGSGDYLLAYCADIFMGERYLPTLRAELEKGLIWVHHPDRWVGVICIQRAEFIAAGGYDERFEFYGKEDKDILARMHRRGKAHSEIGADLSLLYTPWSAKLANYRGHPSRRQVSKCSSAIFAENNARGALVANEGIAWGSYETSP